MPLVRGDRSFLYTDGVIEAADPDGQLFRQERLTDVSKTTTGNDLGRIRRRVLETIRDHTDNQWGHDDDTFMAVEIV